MLLQEITGTVQNECICKRRRDINPDDYNVDVTGLIFYGKVSLFRRVDI